MVMFLVDYRQDVSALLYRGKKLLLDQLLEFLLAASNDLAQLAVFCTDLAVFLVESLVNFEH